MNAVPVALLLHFTTTMLICVFRVDISSRPVFYPWPSAVNVLIKPRSLIISGGLSYSTLNLQALGLPSHVIPYRLIPTYNPSIFGYCIC